MLAPPNCPCALCSEPPPSSRTHQGQGPSSLAWAAASFLHLSILPPGCSFASRDVALGTQTFTSSFCWRSSSWPVIRQFLQRPHRIASTAKQSPPYLQLSLWFSLCTSDHSCLCSCLGQMFTKTCQLKLFLASPCDRGGKNLSSRLGCPPVQPSLFNGLKSRGGLMWGSPAWDFFDWHQKHYSGDVCTCGCVHSLFL